MTDITLIAILKGGARKSTTAMMTAIGLAQLGADVLVVDADTGTQGVTDWATRIVESGGELPCDIVQWSHRAGLLVPFVRDAIDQYQPHHVLIDVGGEAPDIVRQAARLATRVIVPLGPDQAELSRLAPTMQVIRDVRPDVPVAILLTRVPAVGIGSAAETRELLTADGYAVLPVEVPRHAGHYADVWGTVPPYVGAYGHLAAYLRELAQPAEVVAA